ncbi:MAG: glycosyltransferase [Daejeonella sp.]
MKEPFKANILFISTNEIWSGSELLWYESAKYLASQGHAVSAAVNYDHLKISELKHSLHFFIDLRYRHSKLSRIRRLANRVVTVFKTNDVLAGYFKNIQPALVVISQGSSIASPDMIELCSRFQAKFVTLTQLVSEVHWLWLNDDLQQRLKKGYEKSLKNFFVSRRNMELHEFMLAYSCGNNEVVSNPLVVSANGTSYPSGVNYSIAFVGRIECFHKGLDMLLRVLNTSKWKNRPVAFNLYGDGPHVSILAQQIALFEINNIHLKGYTTDVATVWQQNQLMILPSRMEGQSLALIEALSFNRAAIVTDVGGASEIVEDNVTGFIAHDATEGGLDEAMERAWEQREKWENMGIAAGKKIRALRPDQSVHFFSERIMEILQECETS